MSLSRSNINIQRWLREYLMYSKWNGVKISALNLDYKNRDSYDGVSVMKSPIHHSYLGLKTYKGQATTFLLYYGFLYLSK